MSEKLNTELKILKSTDELVQDFVKNKGRQHQFLISELLDQLKLRTYEDLQFALNPYCILYRRDDESNKVQITLRPLNKRAGKLKTKHY